MAKAAKLRKLFGYLRSGDLMPLYLYFLTKIIWPLFPRDLTLKNAVKVTQADWDYLIVLDACRYDTFKKVVDGGAAYVISGGIHTGEWMMWNFGQKHKDVIYIAANPHLASAHLRKRLGFNPFYMVKEVWDYGWDSTLKTVPPEQVTNAALETLKSFPEKRMIIHYMQPHHPYIADKELLEMDDGTYRGFEDIGTGRKQTTPLKLVKRGELPIERVKKAYEENLKAVMREVRRLERELPGRVILTADHGEAFGEHGIYGHRGDLRIEALVKVPWVVLKDKTKRRTKELDVERTRAKARIMKLKDSGRLYKPPQNPLYKG
jgi:hypothetical protein